MVTNEDGSPLMNYRAIANDGDTGIPLGIREATCDEFIEKYGSLFEYNEIEFGEINDPFARLLERIP
jgi:hypothetical protein